MRIVQIQIANVSIVGRNTENFKVSPSIRTM